MTTCIEMLRLALDFRVIVKCTEKKLDITKPLLKEDLGYRSQFIDHSNNEACGKAPGSNANLVMLLAL